MVGMSEPLSPTFGPWETSLPRISPSPSFGECLKHYDKILRSTAAQNWLGQHHKVPHMAHCLILDLCTITHLFAEITNRLEYRVAAKANTPISERVYDTPCGCADAIATKLNNVLPTMQLGEYLTAPFTFALFSPPKKEPEIPADAGRSKSKFNERNSGRGDGPPPPKKQKTGGRLVFITGTGKLPTWNNISKPHAKKLGGSLACAQTL